MTREGWIFMALSWTIILSLFAFALFRTLHQRGDSQPPAAGPPDEA